MLGPPVETNVKGRIFEDTVEYIERGIRVNKRAITEDYNITVERVLSEDGNEIVLTSTASFQDQRPDVQSVQYFSKIQSE